MENREDRDTARKPRVRACRWPLTTVAAAAVPAALLALVSGGCSWTGSSGGQRQQVEFDVSPDGERVAFSAMDGDLYLLELKTRKVSRVTQKTPEWEGTPAFSPDGNSLVFCASRSLDAREPTHLYRCGLDGTGRLQLTSGKDAYDRFPAFSPDGSRLVFARAGRLRPYSMGGWTRDQWDIWDVEAGDGRSSGSRIPRRLTWEAYYQGYEPTFTRDGAIILFTAHPFTASPAKSSSTSSGIYRVNAVGSEPPRLVTQQGWWAAAARDTDKAVFISDRVKSFDYEVWVMDTDGTRVRQVTQNGSYNQQPRLLPGGGGGILFLSDPKRQGRFDLWQVDTDGKSQNMIADSTLFDTPMKWKPRP